MKTIEVEHYNDWSILEFAKIDDDPGNVAVMLYFGDKRIDVVWADKSYGKTEKGNIMMIVPDDFDDSEPYRYGLYIVPRVAGTEWLVEHLTAVLYPIEKNDWYAPPGIDREVIDKIEVVDISHLLKDGK